MSRSQEIGREAEELACRHLSGQGLELVTRNYRCRRGEIDLVMRDNGVTVFVEVRFRRHRSFGGGLESVDARKRQRLLAAAEHYLQQHPRAAHGPCRFDVVAIAPGPEIQWLTNAIEQ